MTDEIHLLVFNTSSGNPPYIWLECGNFSEVSPPLGTITGTKFEDLDGDGNDREGGEPGVGGWTINISGPVDDSTTTNSSGNYSFEDLPAGSYQVSEKPRSGWTQSYPAGNKHTVVIPKTGGTQGSVDFGNFRPAELSGVKFLDNDGDGAREGGAGLSGWQINLQGLDGRGNKVNLATTTNSSGQYSFSVPPGTYSVTEKQRDGWVQTAPQPNPKAGYTRAVQSGEEVGGLDFGNAELGSVSGLKWRDQNADGVQDAGEPRLGGWEIRLDGETGKGAPVHRTTTTDAAGTYAFADLAPGSYVVSEVLQEGWRQTYPAEGSYAVTIKSGVDLTGLDFGNQIPLIKVPRLANLWLCSIDSVSCTNKEAGVEEVNLAIELGKVLDSPDPKQGDPQTIGSFEFEVRFEAKYVNVTVSAGSIFDRSDAECVSIRGEGFVQFRCNITGKPADASHGPGTLAILHVTPTPDVYSLLVANQLNGIVTQLINQDCQLSDLQGHPIKIDACDDAAVTIRYLEGDVHNDCHIDVRDQQQVAFRWGARLGQLLYNSRYDLEPSYPKAADGDIDAKDLQLVFGRAGSTCKAPHPAQPPIDPKAKLEPPGSLDR
jgi:hypothetical protein